jgi:hypothetical protein
MHRFDIFAPLKVHDFSKKARKNFRVYLEYEKYPVFFLSCKQFLHTNNLAAHTMLTVSYTLMINQFLFSQPSDQILMLPHLDLAI